MSSFREASSHSQFHNHIPPMARIRSTLEIPELACGKQGGARFLARCVNRLAHDAESDGAAGGQAFQIPRQLLEHAGEAEKTAAITRDQQLARALAQVSCFDPIFVRAAE